MVTGKTDFREALSDGNTLDELIDEADAMLIFQHRDERLPADGDLETVRQLSDMAAGSVKRYAQRLTVMPLLRQAKAAAGAAEAEEEIPAAQPATVSWFWC